MVIGPRILSRILGRLRHGELEVVWPTHSPVVYRGPEPGPAAVLVVRDEALVRKVVLGGSLGFAEGYLDGLWDTPDLVSLLDLLAANLSSGDLSPRRAPLVPLHRLAHVARRNTRRGARRNISSHYDLGNDFYKLWLDPTMTYSCGLFPLEGEPRPGAPGDTSGPGIQDAGATDSVSALEEAQRAKWDALLDAIEPSPGEHILEIGSGWGGFALHAARTRGCRVTGITLSQEQLDYAENAAAEAGVEDTVRFRLQDYRDVADRFDHVVSIEMFEAVGERYWPTFFTKVRQALRPGGRAGIQVITIDAARLDGYRSRPDFIQTYVFPGGMLPSPEAFFAAARDAGLDGECLALMGSSYARTLSCWLTSFDQAVPAVRRLGFDERFVRTWRYYLAYCIAGFRRGMIDVMQVRLT